MQELSTIVPAREKQSIVKTAISKFRAAIQLQFDFHRAIYNLGTVLVSLQYLVPNIRNVNMCSIVFKIVQYGLAEDTSRTGVLVIGNEIPSDELYSQSAMYITAAHSLKPSYSVSNFYFTIIIYRKFSR